LGLVQPPRGDCAAEVRAAEGHACLYLHANKDDVQKALQQEGSYLRDKLRSSTTVSTGYPSLVLEKSPLSHLEMSEEQLTRLLEKCEECFCLANQDLVTARHRPKSLIFLLAGKAICQDGDEQLFLEPGASMVQMSKDSSRGPVTALSNCKFLLLNRRVLMGFIKSHTDQERQRLLQRLESMPGQVRAPATLRQVADRLSENCLQAAKAALVDNVKSWERPKAKAIISSSLPNSMQTGGRLGNNKKVSIVPPTTAPSQAPDSPSRKRTLPKKIDELDQQEMLFCKDMRRLTSTARACAEDALRELRELRSQADQLRQQLKALAGQEAPSACRGPSRAEVAVPKATRPAESPRKAQHVKFGV